VGQAAAEPGDSTEYPALYVQGGEELKMHPSFVQGAARGLELVFLRDYKGAKNGWDSLEVDFPGTATRHVGRLLIYQSLMLENLDYRFEKQYLTHSALALKALDAAEQVPGNEAWEAFLRGGVEGIEAIHMMRKKQYVASLARGLEALKALEVLREIAPGFVDPLLGDGLYHYWRTVMGQKSRLIPKGEDNQDRGLALMRKAEKEALFVAPAATLSLAYAHLEARRLSEAEAALLRNQALFPDNVLNNMVLARVLIMRGRLPQAMVLLDRVQAVDTDNHRVHYYRATALMRKGELQEAHASIDLYLSLPLEPLYQAVGWHRKGDIHVRERNWDAAINAFGKAVEIDNYEPSKKRLVRLEKRKRAQGKPGGSK
jgi:predicted negative regulator of RcsB-dependent stress response